jgi:hypothetical protein
VLLDTVDDASILNPAAFAPRAARAYRVWRTESLGRRLSLHERRRDEICAFVARSRHA